ncbi:hypothetical protein TGGT1_306390 [Toxoplasma gondii GT1]|uniref:Uncharacterized protein n=1 Tax=Toxoplasma gondii (strain ATCC 50853 / GT1) TaxID=507601 RepID=S7UIC4_TOXGG|nr:hypothetical protein TGGT1_306390 [Toxoplasma gondii GT1]
MFGEAVDDGNTNSFPRENSRFPRASTSSTRPATRSDSVRRSFLVLSLLRRRSPATLPFFVVKMTDSNTNPALKFQRSVEELTSQNPHTDDPRSMQFNQMNTCSLRYAMFARCAKELGDDHTRCKYQFYRAQVACPIEQIELWEDYRQKGMFLEFGVWLVSLFRVRFVPLCDYASQSCLCVSF